MHDQRIERQRTRTKRNKKKQFKQIFKLYNEQETTTMDNHHGRCFAIERWPFAKHELDSRLGTHGRAPDDRIRCAHLQLFVD